MNGAEHCEQVAHHKSTNQDYNQSCGGCGDFGRSFGRQFLHKDYLTLTVKGLPVFLNDGPAVVIVAEMKSFDA